MRKWNRSLLAVLFVLCLVVSAQASLFGPKIDVVDQAYVKEKVGQPELASIFCGSGSGVEHRLAKARVASSNLVFCSKKTATPRRMIRGSSPLRSLRRGSTAAAWPRRSSTRFFKDGGSTQTSFLLNSRSDASM